MIRLFICCIVFCSISLTVNAQELFFLDSIKIPSNNVSLFLRTCYYDYLEENGESSRKEFENGIDLKLHFFTNNSRLIDSIGKIWKIDSSNFVGCFCGYDFEIFLYSGDNLIKKMKYAFCCNDLVINKKHLFLDKDKMTQTIKFMTPIENKNSLDFIKNEWIEY